MFDHVLWNYPSIAFLIMAVFYFVSGAFMLAVREKSPATFHAGAFLVLGGVLTSAYAVAHVLYDPSAALHRYFTIVPAICFGAHLLHFLIHYPEPKKSPIPRAILIVQWIVALGVLALFISSVQGIPRVYNFSSHIWDFDAEAISKNVGIVIVGYTLVYMLFGFGKLIVLRGKGRWAFGALLFAFISINFVPGVLNILSRDGAMDRNVFVTIFSLISLIGGFVFVVLYINNTRDRTTFMTKVSGITFVSILVIIQIVAFISIKGSEDAFDALMRKEGKLYLAGLSDETPEYRAVFKREPKGSFVSIAPDAKTADAKAPGAEIANSVVLPTEGAVSFENRTIEFENTLVLDEITKLPAAGFSDGLTALLTRIPEGFKGYAAFIQRHAAENPGTNAKQILEHLSATERLIGYRAFKIRALPDKDFRAALGKFLSGSGDAFSPFRTVIEERVAKSKAEGAGLKREVLSYLTPAHTPGTRWYRDSRDGKSQFVSYMFVTAPGTIVELGYPYLQYRRHLDHIGRRIASVIAAVVIFVLVGFRLFFGPALLNPLEDLLRGVREVNNGDFNVIVQPRVEDEIGFLSRSFNGMVESIRDARRTLQEYAASLEDKVKARTAELEETLNQVQKLKTQQDGDYFLTALLLQPLRQNRAKSELVSVQFFQRQKKSFTFRQWNDEIGGDLCTSNNLKLGGRAYTVFLNADAMGKSMQGAGGALVLGSVFEAILERTQITTAVQDQSPERWMKNAFLELHKVFEAFDCSMMVSMVLGLIDDESGLLYYINAEHPFSILYRGGRAAFTESETHLLKLGSPNLAQAGGLAIRTLQLEPGDVLIVGSDGRDDILLKEDGREPFMNEDETMILRHVEKAGGNLDALFEELSHTGDVTDDLTFVRIGYRENGSKADASPPTAELLRLLNEAKLAATEQNHKSALALLEAAHRQDPKRPEVLRRLALAYVKMEMFDQAAETAREYTEIRPGDTEFLYLTSYSLRKMKQLKMAADFGERVRLRNPRHIRNLINLADIYAVDGNAERASMLLQLALDLDPSNAGALRRMKSLELAVSYQRT